MNIQPVNKAVEHMINSTPVLGKEKERERERERERVRVLVCVCVRACVRACVCVCVCVCCIIPASMGIKLTFCIALIRQ